MKELCFTLSGGERICIRIPILIDRQWYDPNPPDPIGPWAQLVELTTIAELPSLASTEIGQEIQRLARQGLERTLADLGSGAELRDLPGASSSA